MSLPEGPLQPIDHTFTKSYGTTSLTKPKVYKTILSENGDKRIVVEIAKDKEMKLHLSSKGIFSQLSQFFTNKPADRLITVMDAKDLSDEDRKNIDDVLNDFSQANWHSSRQSDFVHTLVRDMKTFLEKWDHSPELKFKFQATVCPQLENVQIQRFIFAELDSFLTTSETEESSSPEYKTLLSDLKEMSQFIPSDKSIKSNLIRFDKLIEKLEEKIRSTGDQTEKDALDQTLLAIQQKRKAFDRDLNEVGSAENRIIKFKEFPFKEHSSKLEEYYQKIINEINVVSTEISKTLDTQTTDSPSPTKSVTSNQENLKTRILSNLKHCYESGEGISPEKRSILGVFVKLCFDGDDLNSYQDKLESASNKEKSGVSVSTVSRAIAAQLLRKSTFSKGDPFTEYFFRFKQMDSHATAVFDESIADK